MRSKRIPVGSAVEEFSSVSLGDQRLDVRVLKLVAAMESDPAATFPQAVKTVAEREATYRLLNNVRVELFRLLLPHVEQTISRAGCSRSRPLVIVDKTAFVFSGEADRDGLDRLGARRHGFDCFFALAVTGERFPLGVVAIEPTDSHRRSSGDVWNEVIVSAASHVGALSPIYVMDREADAYGLLAALATDERDFVIRAATDRWVRDGEEWVKVQDAADLCPVLMRRSVQLSRRTATRRLPGARRRHPPRDARDAELTVRACTVNLPRPRMQPEHLPEWVTVNLVRVREENPPKGMDPIEWLLLTTLPIATATDVAAIVDAYRARWTIEEYFKVLKTGCSYEKRQLESRHALLNALGILAPIAWRLLALRSAGDDPKSLASEVLDDDELHVLRKLSRDIKLGRRPTAAEAVMALARLGGHFPQNGRPGWMVIWKGFDQLLQQVAGYRLARAEM